MAANDRRESASLSEALFKSPHEFEFFQAVRLLEAMYLDRARVAETLDPELELVRFRSHVSLAFPPSDIHSIRRPRPDKHAEMTVNFMGLAGVNGPLPQPFTELVIERTARHDTALRDFLDLFNHRLVSLFYRARKKYRSALDTRPPHSGRVAGCVFALIGLATGGLRERLAVPDRTLLTFAGLLTGFPRSAAGLRRMLAQYFSVPVALEPFSGAWLEISEDECTRLGASGQANVLGRNTVLGEHVWDQQSEFEVRLGPLPLGEYLRFLPNAAGFHELCSLIRFYVGKNLAFRIRLAVAGADVPELRLGSAGEARLGWTSRFVAPAETGRFQLGRSGGNRLGWTSWLTTDGSGLEHPEIVLRGEL